MMTSSTERHLLASGERRDRLRRDSAGWRSLTMAGDTLTALESMLAGFLWPLAGYSAPGRPPRTVEGELPIEAALPLEVPADLASALAPAEWLALRDPEGVLLAALRTETLVHRDGRHWLEGTLEGVELPGHDDFAHLRLAPRAIAERLREHGRGRVLAFLAGGVLHAAHRAALTRAAELADASILVLIGSHAGEHDDLADFGQLRALQISAGLLPAARALTAVVPMPRTGSEVSDLVRTAMMARNAGASHLAIDVSEHGGSGALEAVSAAASVIGIEIVPVRPWGYHRSTGRLVSLDEATVADVEVPPPAARIASSVPAVPDWLLEPEEREALTRAYVPRSAQGFTVFFTGLSGSGKSTIARALRIRLMELTGRPVTLLDGDRVRRHLSSELGFSREHRNLNILRIGWVAAEITRHGGIAICAPIAPYEAVRREVRQMVEAAGGFVLVHVATPLETCEARDRKGLYARARAGQIPQFTGISDAYEPPPDAAIAIDTRGTPVDAACRSIVDVLIARGYLVPRS